ncbi:MAG TPA: crosslink repair DNA glycosylase YcaQ family protein, partial [Gaiellaceae bacterium]|nr:crosslink repair DNA glycosylase YcaQ family protein [Gaiellaceae bacterium]
MRLTLGEARRLAVAGQLLDSPQPRSILEVVEWLGSLQMDPTNAVARSERLVLWSRLGHYDLAELDRLRWKTRDLFDYWAHIVPASDYAIHRETMRRYPHGAYARSNYIHEWLAANGGFRRYVLRELRR